MSLFLKSHLGEVYQRCVVVMSETQTSELGSSVFNVALRKKLLSLSVSLPWSRPKKFCINHCITDTISGKFKV